MKASVDAKTFSAALDKASTVLKRSQFPALNTVSLRFGDGKCVMTATDLSTWLSVEIPAQGDVFECAFYHSKDAAKACRFYEGPLSLEIVDSEAGRHMRRQIILSCGFRTAEFEGLPPDEDLFTLPTDEVKASFSVDAAALLKRVERVKYAAMKDTHDTRPSLTCVQFEKNMVLALDGQRAAYDTDPLMTFPRPFLVKADALAHLKLFGDSQVQTHVGVRLVQFVGEGISLCCHNEGIETFKLDQAIHKDFQDELHIHPKEFLRELGYLKSLLHSKEKPYIRFHGGELSLDAVSRQGQTSVPIDGKSTIEFGFDLNLMAEALKRFEGEARVKIKVANSFSPLILEAEGRNDHALVLPVKLRQNQAAA